MGNGNQKKMKLRIPKITQRKLKVGLVSIVFVLVAITLILIGLTLNNNSDIPVYNSCTESQAGTKFCTEGKWYECQYLGSGIYAWANTGESCSSDTDPETNPACTPGRGGDSPNCSTGSTECHSGTLYRCVSYDCDYCDGCRGYQQNTGESCGNDTPEPTPNPTPNPPPASSDPSSSEDNSQCTNGDTRRVSTCGCQGDPTKKRRQVCQNGSWVFDQCVNASACANNTSIESTSSVSTSSGSTSGNSASADPGDESSNLPETGIIDDNPTLFFGLALVLLGIVTRRWVIGGRSYSPTD